MLELSHGVYEHVTIVTLTLTMLELRLSLCLN